MQENKTKTRQPFTMNRIAWIERQHKYETQDLIGRVRKSSQIIFEFTYVSFLFCFSFLHTCLHYFNAIILFLTFQAKSRRVKFRIACGIQNTEYGIQIISHSHLTAELRLYLGTVVISILHVIEGTVFPIGAVRAFEF